MAETPTIPPTNPTIATGSTAGTPSPNTGEGTPTGQLLNAVVVRGTQNQSATLRLEDGSGQKLDVQVRTQLLLPQGAQLTVRLTASPTGNIRAQGFDFQARVVTVNGAPPALSSGSDENATVLKGTLPRSLIGVLTKGLPSPPSSHTSPNTQSRGLATPSPHPAPVSHPVTTPGTATSVHISSGQVISSVVLHPSTDANSFLPEALSQRPLQSGDNLQLRVLTTQNPAPTTAEPASFKPPPITNQGLANLARTDTGGFSSTTFTGSVSGVERSGEIVLQTPIGSIKIPPIPGVVRGALVQFSIASVVPSSSGPSQAIPTSPTIAAFLGPDSPFGQLVNTLVEGGDIARVTQLFPTFIPHNTPQGENNARAAVAQSAAKLLWFLGGVQKGKADTWLGKDIRQQLEQQGMRELLPRLEQSFTGLRNLWQEPGPTGWQTLLFPVWDSTQLKHGMLHLHRDGRSKQGEQNRKDIKRFMVEVGLESLGPIQLEGLVRPANREEDTSAPPIQQLEIHISSVQALDENTQNGIRDILQAHEAITGMSGIVQFRVDSSLPPSPLYQRTGGHMIDDIMV